MNQQTSESLANMSIGATTATGLVAFLEQHASLFTIGIAFCGLILALIFNVLNYRLKKKQLEQEKDEHEIKVGLDI